MRVRNSVTVIQVKKLEIEKKSNEYIKGFEFSRQNTYLPRIHCDSINFVFHHSFQESTIAVIRLGVKCNTINGRQSERIQSTHVEKPIAANDTIASHLVKPMVSRSIRREKAGDQRFVGML